MLICRLATRWRLPERGFRRIVGLALLALMRGNNATAHFVEFRGVDYVFGFVWQNFVDVDGCSRVVACLVHILQAQQIGFALEGPGEAQKSERNSQSRALPDGVSGPATQKNQRRSGQVHYL